MLQALTKANWFVLRTNAESIGLQSQLRGLKEIGHSASASAQPLPRARQPPQARPVALCRSYRQSRPGYSELVIEGRSCQAFPFGDPCQGFGQGSSISRCAARPPDILLALDRAANGRHAIVAGRFTNGAENAGRKDCSVANAYAFRTGRACRHSQAEALPCSDRT